MQQVCKWAFKPYFINTKWMYNLFINLHIFSYPCHEDIQDVKYNISNGQLNGTVEDINLVMIKSTVTEIHQVIWCHSLWVHIGILVQDSGCRKECSSHRFGKTTEHSCNKPLRSSVTRSNSLQVSRHVWCSNEHLFSNKCIFDTSKTVWIKQTSSQFNFEHYFCFCIVVLSWSSWHTKQHP